MSSGMIYVHEPQAMSSQTSKAQVRHTYKADIQGMHAHWAAGAEDHARVRHTLTVRRTRQAYI